jgi:polysaccharide biosynthesis PFTS motif protein
VNIENINLEPTYFWRCMTWPNYLVWDSFQKEFIRRCIGNQPDVKIEIVKSIWFEDSGSGKLPRDTGGIAIFDVMPHRHFVYCTYADENEYVVPHICLSFIQDILEVARQEKTTCCYKAKREIGKLCHPSYRQLIEKMSTNTDVTVISSDTSAYELISLSSVVICFPFTAPAVIAQELGKPVCYYDPVGLVDDNHPAAHGIKVIGNKSVLLSWLKEQLAC